MTHEPEPTPSSLGYRMPAEWEPHAATWLAWPHNREDWPGKFAPVPWVYAEIVRLLTSAERVNLLVKGRKRERLARQVLESHGVNLDRVTFVKASTDRVWTRDTCPSFVVSDRGEPLGLVDWKFNGWAKYDNHARDDRLGRKVADAINARRWAPRVEIEEDSTRVVMEGGAFDVNGLGTILVTEECLLDDVQARNPKLGREGIERVFADYLGVTNVVWLGRGIDGDDTHGHVDDLARFVSPTKVVTVVETSKDDPNYEPLRDNLARLKAARDQAGQPFEVVELPMPSPVVFEGQRLPASYANFYVANGLVLVPTFNDPNDRIALNTLADCFPDRRVVGVHAVDLVLGLGTLHCLTQQQPA